MPEYSINSEIRGAFRFGPDNLTRLHALISRFYGEPASADISLENDHRLSADNIQDILDDPIIQAARISRVSISGSSFKVDKRISLIIREGAFDAVVDISISGQKNDCISLRNDIESEIKPTLPWYNFAYKYDSAYMLTFMIAAFILGFFGTIKYKLSGLDQFYFAALVISTVTFIAYKGRKMLLPRLVFDVGYGSRSSRKISKIASFIFIGVILTIVLGVVGNFVTDWLKRTPAP